VRSAIGRQAHHAPRTWFCIPNALYLLPHAAWRTGPTSHSLPRSTLAPVITPHAAAPFYLRQAPRQATGGGVTAGPSPPHPQPPATGHRVCVTCSSKIFTVGFKQAHAVPPWLAGYCRRCCCRPSLLLLPSALHSCRYCCCRPGISHLTGWWGQSIHRQSHQEVPGTRDPTAARGPWYPVALAGPALPPRCR
jgi:hypothetical protein